MSTTCELTPSRQVIGMCSSRGEKERICLDSTPRSMEGQGKEGRSVIVTVGSLEEEEAKSKNNDRLKEYSHQEMPF